MAPSKTHAHLIWLDLEMTGLIPSKHTILEIATIVTDSHLNILAEGPEIAIRHDSQTLDLMEAWSRDTHTKSGLLQRVKDSTIGIKEAEHQTLEFIKTYCAKKKSPLCGNSIGHDRRFLERDMPTLFDFLHYRNVDVSTIKELIKRWYTEGPQPPEKAGKHLALHDIRESIEELKFYRDHYFLKM
ncbi:MAG: oligoribonuclease [Nitrospiria bacterium]